MREHLFLPLAFSLEPIKWEKGEASAWAPCSRAIWGWMGLLQAEEMHQVLGVAEGSLGLPFPLQLSLLLCFTVPAVAELLASFAVVRLWLPWALLAQGLEMVPLPFPL